MLILQEEEKYLLNNSKLLGSFSPQHIFLNLKDMERSSFELQKHVMSYLPRLCFCYQCLRILIDFKYNKIIYMENSVLFLILLQHYQMLCDYFGC